MNNLDEKLVERLVGRIEELNTNILKKIGKTIKEIKKITPTQAHQLEKILKYGNNYKDIVNKIAKTTNLNIDEIDNIFNAYAKQDYTFAKDFYDYKGITYKSYKDFELLNRQVQSLARITQQGCLEIAKTNALGYTITDLNGNIRFKQLKDAYQYAIDQAILSISQGKDTFDNQMYGILKDLGGGLKTIDYESGRTRRLDSALRMNLMGGLRDLHNETQKIIGEDFGANGVEITVHEAPAPDHADLQGKQFSYVEYEKLQNNMLAKDYKGHIYTHDHRPISQFNCYHTTFAILLGVNKPQYTDEQLNQIKQRNEKGFDFEGKHYTMYEGTQLQRRLETEIRKQKDTQILAKESDNNLLINSTQQKITQLSNKYKQLSNASGLPMKQDRLRVSGYKRIKVEITNDTKTNNIKYDFAKHRGFIDDTKTLVKLYDDFDYDGFISEYDNLYNSFNKNEIQQTYDNYKKWTKTDMNTSNPIGDLLNKKLNYDAKPELINEQEFWLDKNGDPILSHNDTTLLDRNHWYRGIAGADDLEKAQSSLAIEKAQKYIKDFKNGDFFAGKGINGNGTYVSGSYKYAKKYASYIDENIIYIMPKETAKIVSVDKINYIKSNILKHLKNRDQLYVDFSTVVLNDNGYLSEILGYDIVNLGENKIVLNRGAIKVVK